MSHRITRRTVLQAGVAAAVAGLPTMSFAQLDGYKPAVPGRPVPPASAFGKRSTAEEVTAGMDLSGKTALVTGCNSGLGYETLRVLALRGAHVIGAARTLEKAEKACASVDGKSTPLAVELTDLPGIVAAAAKVADMGEPLDMLILNAGIMQLPELQLVNGVERQFAVNHVGHFLLTHRLLDQVVAAEAGRVVVVSSGAHRWARQGIRFDNLDGSQDYDPREAYGVSKTANGLFSRELARRLADTNATSNSLHPGRHPDESRAPPAAARLRHEQPDVQDDSRRDRDAVLRCDQRRPRGRHRLLLRRLQSCYAERAHAGRCDGRKTVGRVGRARRRLPVSAWPTTNRCTSSPLRSSMT